jgi:hypothetical protein
MCHGRKRRRDNAGNLRFVSAAMLEYYSYHTKLFYKCFNACNQCAEAEKGAETMPEILALLARHC